MYNTPFYMISATADHTPACILSFLVCADCLLYRQQRQLVAYSDLWVFTGQLTSHPAKVHTTCVQCLPPSLAFSLVGTSGKMSHDGCEEVTWKGNPFPYLMHHSRFHSTENYGSARQGACLTACDHHSTTRTLTKKLISSCGMQSSHAEK